MLRLACCAPLRCRSCSSFSALVPALRPAPTGWIRPRCFPTVSRWLRLPCPLASWTWRDGCMSLLPIGSTTLRNRSLGLATLLSRVGIFLRRRIGFAKPRIGLPVCRLRLPRLGLALAAALLSGVAWPWLVVPSSVPLRLPWTHRLLPGLPTDLVSWRRSMGNMTRLKPIICKPLGMPPYPSPHLTIK